MHARQAGLKVQSCEHVRFWRNKNIIWEIKYKIEFQNPFNIMFCSGTWLNLSPEDVNTSPTHFLVYGLMLRDTITKAYLHRHIFYIYLKAHLYRQKSSSRNNRLLRCQFLNFARRQGSCACQSAHRIYHKIGWDHETFFSHPCTWFVCLKNMYERRKPRDRNDSPISGPKKKQHTHTLSCGFTRRKIKIRVITVLSAVPRCTCFRKRDAYK